VRRLRVATTNAGKLREFRALLEPLGFEVAGISDLGDLGIVEDGDSFEANALIKARAVANVTGDATVADDSGLVVDALGGAPGIHSARYAGVEPPANDAANRKKLLDALGDIPDVERTARFVCALAYLPPGGEPIFARGTFEGRIGYVERGTHGFGYDSIFLVHGGERTAAELPPEQKNTVSHRAQALQQLVAVLRGS